jgi:two-component system, response regulator
MTAASVSHRGPEEGTMSAIEILLVEDNPDDLALVLRVLRRQDLAHRVEVVQDGAEALDFLFCTGAYAHRRLEDRPRVILLDLKLSKVTGLEVLQRLKSDPRTRAIPVVIFSSSAQDRDVMACYELGANSYILKPLDMSELTEAVSQIARYWLGLNRTTPA